MGDLVTGQVTGSSVDNVSDVGSVTGMRVVVCGSPRAGKSTLARTLGSTVYHLDSLVSLPWSEQSTHAQAYLTLTGPWVIDGCASSRMLRKWLAGNAGKPCDVIIRMVDPLVALTRGQSTLAKGESTIWSEIEPMLRERGVRIQMYSVCKL